MFRRTIVVLVNCYLDKNITTPSIFAWGSYVIYVYFFVFLTGIIMYVGITRAKKRLIITHAKQRQIYGTSKYQKPSLFLNELPEQFVVRLKEKPAVTLRIPERMQHYPQQSAVVA